MKRAFTVIYSILCIIVFFALFLFSGLALFRIYQDTHAACTSNLNQVKSRCVIWQQQFYSGYELDTAVRGIMQEFDRLLIVTVYSPAKGILYASSRPAQHAPSYLKSSISTAADNIPADWRGTPVYQELPFAGSEIIKTKILTDPADDLVVEGVYVVLTYAEIFGVLKYGFLTIAILLIISIFIRFFVGNEAKSSLDYSFDQDLPLPGDLGREDSPANTSEEQSAAPIQNSVSARKAYEEQLDTTFEQIKKPSARDLFSPKTGMGWEDHLLQRLNTEIKRTSSFDQDMSFALIRINRYETLNQVNEVTRVVAKIILELFLFQDLCFEYGPGGFAVILPDIEINQAIKEMEIFQRKIRGAQILEQFVTVSIGLSSRNGRLISSEILFKETEKALEKAAVDQTNNIVAFKPDPDKYRDMVARNSGNTERKS